MSNIKAIQSDEIALLIPFIKGLTGTILDDSKAYLFETRLGPLLQKYSLHSYSELIQASRRNSQLETEIIDNITTHETLFFRDNHPFEYIQNKFFPEFFEQHGMNARLRIWSAACSSGQEPYSIAISLMNILFNLDKYDIRILGTDICDDSIRRASMGRYSKFELRRGIETPKLDQYFNNEGENWKIKDEIRVHIKFQRFNLLNNFFGIEKQHLIFCRNVAIYFNKEDRAKLYDKIADQLHPDGVLITSAAENLFGITDRFKMDTFRGAFYYRKIY
ncbi:MAG: protein-glutamate O-methyltransferase CheR [Lentisphaeraceae bacterium]|nr:protein-glutamate O-methyltransferase CheR [Lentisphaeraceae bacterium]